MSYRIIIDSCGELTKELKADGHFVNAPLTLNVDGRDFVDDETFDQLDFLKAVAESPNVPKSACPSPDSYLHLIEETDAEHIYIITLSEQLSGSYNSACIAKEMYLEDHDDKKILVYNSRSASIGETLIGIYIQQLEEQETPFEEIEKLALTYSRRITTLFVLENLETLRKNGRMSKMKALAASALNIKPVLANTDDGNICMVDQARGINKALVKMVQKIVAKLGDEKCDIIAVSHCNNRARAMEVKELLDASGRFHRIIVVNTAGCSSMYANQGGIIMAFPAPKPVELPEVSTEEKLAALKASTADALEEGITSLMAKGVTTAEQIKERLHRD